MKVTADTKIDLAPYRSITGPSNGEVKAASNPPKDTAPENIALDQPNSSLIGATKIEVVATAGPCRANPTKQTQPKKTTHRKMVIPMCAFSQSPIFIHLIRIEVAMGLRLEQYPDLSLLIKH